MNLIAQCFDDLNTKTDVIELTPSTTISSPSPFSFQSTTPLNSSPEKKHITWAEELVKEPNNIFSKLKTIKPLSPSDNNILLAKTNLKKPGEESDFYKKEKYDILVNKIDLVAQKVDLLIDVLLGVKPN